MRIKNEMQPKRAMHIKREPIHKVPFIFSLYRTTSGPTGALIWRLQAIPLRTAGTGS